MPGTEAIWDVVLSSGKLIFGIASDDAHHFKTSGDRSAAAPGRGWIYVRASELTQRSILEALERGDFYASTGVELEDYFHNEKAVSLKIKEERWSKYTTQFIGRGGRVLSETISNPAVYKISGNEGYVRARVLESNGKMAWTQPVFILKQPALLSR
jgi:hypothetical protein